MITEQVRVIEKLRKFTLDIELSHQVRLGANGLQNECMCS